MLYRWNKLLLQNKLSEVRLRDRRYDAVFHLVTAADGAEEFYGKGNDARYESEKEAILIDKKLQLAWLGHPRHEIIDNYSVDDF